MHKDNFTGLIKGKHRKGLTLVELIIAVTILAIGTAGVVTLFHVSFTSQMRASDLSSASIEAQMQMERIIGRPWLHVEECVQMNVPSCACPDDGCAIRWNEPFESEGLWYRVTFRPHRALGDHGWNNMDLELGGTRLFDSQFPDDPPLAEGACTNPTPCGTCLAEHLHQIRVAVYAYKTQQDAIAHNVNPYIDPPTWFFRQGTIVNLTNHII